MSLSLDLLSQHLIYVASSSVQLALSWFFFLLQGKESMTCVPQHAVLQAAGHLLTHSYICQKRSVLLFLTVLSGCWWRFWVCQVETQESPEHIFQSKLDYTSMKVLPPLRIIEEFTTIKYVLHINTVVDLILSKNQLYSD